MNLRAPHAGEAPALARLHLDTALVAYAGIFPPEAPVPGIADVIELWERALRSPRTAGFVATVDDTAVGVVVAGPDPEDGDRGHLSRLYVAPDLWGRGIGRRLHDAALDHLRRQTFGQATLWVLERNERARRWYERLGWTATGQRKPVYRPAGIDDVRYVRDLGASEPGQ